MAIGSITRALPAGEPRLGQPELADITLRALVPLVHAGLPVGTEVFEVVGKTAGSTLRSETAGLVANSAGTRLVVGMGIRKTERVRVSENLATAKTRPLPKYTDVAARVYPALPALPLRAGCRTMAIGDSQIGYNNYGGAAISTGGRAAGSLGYGALKHAQWADPRFDFASWYDVHDISERNIEGANQGVFGDHMRWNTNDGGILGRLQKLLTSGRLPELLILEGGTNTISSGDDGVGGTAAYVQARLDECIDLARFAGIPVILMTIYPREDWTDAARKNTVRTVNTWIRQQASRDGVVGIIDPYDFLAPGGTMDRQYFLTDYVHLNNRGAAVVGRNYVLPVIQNVVKPGVAPGLSGLNLLPSALAGLTGSAGGKGTGVTGQTANSINVTIGGQATVAASKEAVSGGTEKQVLAITPGATSSGTTWGEVAVSLGTAAIASSARAAGNWFVRGVVVEVSGPECLSELRLAGGLRAAGVTLTNCDVGQVFSTDFDKAYPSGATYTVFSDPFQAPDDLAIPDSLLGILYVRFNKAGQPFTVKVSAPFLRQVDDPRPLWGWPARSASRLFSLGVAQTTFLRGTTAADMRAFVTKATDGTDLTMDPPQLDLTTRSFSLTERGKSAPEDVVSGPFSCTVIADLQDLTLGSAIVTPGVDFVQTVQKRAGGSTIVVDGFPIGGRYDATKNQVIINTTQEGIFRLRFTETFGSKTRVSYFYVVSSAYDYVAQFPSSYSDNFKFNFSSNPATLTTIGNHSAFGALSIGRSKKDPNLWRFAVTRAGENWAGDGSRNDQRSEFQIPATWDFNRDVWLYHKFRVMGLTMANRSYFCVGQFQLSRDVGDAGASPCCSMNINGGSLIFETRSAPEKISNYAPPPVERFRMPFTEAMWYDVVMRVKFNPFGQGAATLWINGDKKFDQSNIPVGHNDDRGPYWKIGVYTGPKTKDPEQVVIGEYAKPEIGYESLLGRVTQPYQIAA